MASLGGATCKFFARIRCKRMSSANEVLVVFESFGRCRHRCRRRSRGRAPSRLHGSSRGAGSLDVRWQTWPAALLWCDSRRQGLRATRAQLATWFSQQQSPCGSLTLHRKLLMRRHDDQQCRTAKEACRAAAAALAASGRQHSESVPAGGCVCASCGSLLYPCVWCEADRQGWAVTQGYMGSWKGVASLPRRHASTETRSTAHDKCGTGMNAEKGCITAPH